MDYERILALTRMGTGEPVTHGETVVFIWKTEAHLREWFDGIVNVSDTMRVERLPSRNLQALGINQVDTIIHDNNIDLDNTCIFAIAYGVVPNYEDLQIVYHKCARRERRHQRRR